MFISPRNLSRGDQAVTAHTTSVPPPSAATPRGSTESTPGRLWQRDGAAGGGEDRTLHRGSSDGVSCARDDRQQVPCLAGGLLDRLIGDMEHDLGSGNAPAAAQGGQPLTRRPWDFSMAAEGMVWGGGGGGGFPGSITAHY